MKCEQQYGVSLCMIVRDEEAYIEACLRSAMPYVTEMIVCDTGSQDRTREIAERLGARVERTEWKDHFAEARNYSISLASQPWILVLDADERLEPPPAEEWSGLLADERNAGYCVRLVSPLARNNDEGDDTAVTDAVCRLFRNDPRIRFDGIIHEECATAVAAVQGFPPVIAPLAIRHEGYRANVIEQKRKPERNMRLLAKALEREPDNVVLRYAAGTEMVGAGRWADAISWLLPLTDQIEDKYGFASDIQLKLSHALRMAGRLEEAAEQALAGIRSYPDFPDLYEALAAVRMAQDDAGAALAAYRQAIALGEAVPHYSSVKGAGSYRSMCGAGAACERLYRWSEAGSWYTQALEVHPLLEQARERLLLLLQAGLPVDPVVAAAVEQLAVPSAHYKDTRQATQSSANALSALPLSGGKLYDRELAEAMLAAAACRWAPACDSFAAARDSAASPVQGRAAAVGLSAAFAARAEEHIAAIASGMAANGVLLNGSASGRSEGEGALTDIGAHSLHCRSELQLIGLTALYPPSS